jgi:lipopolysaccharide transport system ATP-binding protein
MTNPIIEAAGVGKRYRLSHLGPRSATLRESLTNAFRSLGQKKTAGDGASIEEFWALQDVSFEIMPGEVIGIIGRNGAGKSTLLKILSRITEPTAGEVTLRGHVASLLEVGTGFHGELSGRENIFLNGTILGLTREQIRAKFDEIVEFAEVEKFLDTPVKRYSSGMYTRLAFAVAAHLEPDILIVDEVLAVGDMQFQKKCLGKMGEAARGGRTVLFVSHNMAAMKQLCQRGILLSNGRVVFDGGIHECAALYASNASQTHRRIVDYAVRKHASVTVETVTANGSEADELHLPAGEREIRLEMSGVVHSPVRGEIQARLLDNQGTPIGIFSPAFEEGGAGLLPAGPFHLTRTLRLPRLNRGEYAMTFELVQPNVIAWFEAAAALRMFVEGTSMNTGQTFNVSQGLGWLLMDEVRQ